MTKKQYAYLRIVFGLSLTCTVGSLYVEHFGDPVLNIMSGDLWNQSLGIVACNLCRYIRIFTYPLVIISLVGLVRKDVNVAHSIFWLSMICLGFCIYKYGLEMAWRTSNANSFLCVSGTADCAEAKPLYFGFLSLSGLGALVSLTIMNLCCGIIKDTSNNQTL